MEIAPGELMQQRRVRLGDILDDYCPRERRITNHAVVAMIDDEVKQTRCTTCQSDHEYKGARTPPPRRRKTGALSGDDTETVIRPRAAVPVPNTAEPADDDVEPDESANAFADVSADSQPVPTLASDPTESPEPEPGSEAEGDAREDRDEWPVHRPLIRATLPRPEGQPPERKAPDFTFRPGGGRFDSPRNGKRHRGPRPARQGQGQSGGQGRFQGPRQSPGQGSPHGPRHGSGRPRQGSGQGGPSGQRHGPGGGRPAQGRGPRQGSGPGRKRGR